MSVENLVSSGPLLLAMPVAAAAGAVTFLSPCCLPLVPGYLAYITGMSGADSHARRGTASGAANANSAGTASAVAADGTVAVGGSGTATVTTAPATVPAPAGPGGARRGQMVAGTALFVLGFSLVFCLIGLAAGGVGELLQSHTAGITRVLGGVTILLGLMFFGAFDRFMFAGRVFKPSFMPKAGLAGAPLLGVLFGVSWTPCIGPTLMAVQALSLSSGTAARGAFLAFIYGLGLGIPFLIVAAAFQRAMNFLAFFKRHAHLVTRIGGLMLIALGVIEVTGAWTSVIAWLHTHWFSGYDTPL
jgi:cytochrome c-type biogenesis protein